MHLNDHTHLCGQQEDWDAAAVGLEALHLSLPRISGGHAAINAAEGPAARNNSGLQQQGGGSSNRSCVVEKRRNATATQDMLPSMRQKDQPHAATAACSRWR
jgi:hypothetical protein